MDDKKRKFILDNRLQRVDRSVGKFCRPVFREKFSSAVKWHTIKHTVYNFVNYRRINAAMYAVLHLAQV